MTVSGAVKLTFSDYFQVSKEVLSAEGFFNISLRSDLPLFIDPFHLFYSEKEDYRKLHAEIIRYLAFLRKISTTRGKANLSKGVIEAYYRFPEVRQNWFGFTFQGNRGHGLGIKFAKTLNQNFNDFFSDFGQGTKARHLEKLTLIADGVGRDTISDFATNLIHGYLAKKTQEFSLKYLKPEQLKEFTIKRASFDFKSGAWVHGVFKLPSIRDSRGRSEYVLLTPNDLLTKDDTWINKADFFDDFAQIPNAAPSAALREQLSTYFSAKLVEYAKRKINKRTNKITLSFPKKSRSMAALDTIKEFPQTIDIYIRIKEENGQGAVQRSKEVVSETQEYLEGQFREFAETAGVAPGRPKSYEEAYARVMHFKEVIEKVCYKNLYINEKPVSEDWVQRMFWFEWYGAESDLNREPDNGLGEPDYIASLGSKDKTLIEFKLAGSKTLESNLLNQLEKYKETNNAKKGIWAIIFFTVEEEKKVGRILKKHKLDNDKDYILIDARRDNKITASRIK